MKIKNDYDLDKLVIEYGFRRNMLSCYEIYIYDIYKDENKTCEILVNTVEHKDRKIRFYYFNDLNENINFYYHDGKINEFTTDPVDYDVEIPDVIFKMIQDNIVEI